MSHPLLIVGSVGIDSIHTPTGHASHQLGGSASFAALAARHWVSPLVLSAIGGDFPEDLKSRLSSSGIDLRHLTVDAGAKSFRWAGAYDEGLGTRQTVAVELGVMGTHRLHAPQMSAVRFAMMGNYNPHMELELIPQLSPQCFIACDTIHGWIEHQREGVGNLFRACHLVTIDQAELMEYTGIPSEAPAVAKLLSMGPRWVIIKYGAHGSRLYGARGESATMGIYRTQAKDTTGAGDTYLGTIMAYLTQVGSVSVDTLTQGMRLGAAAASITVEAFGVDALIQATRAEIERRAKLVK